MPTLWDRIRRSQDATSAEDENKKPQQHSTSSNDAQESEATKSSSTDKSTSEKSTDDGKKGSTDKVKLQRSVTLLNGCTIIIGCMIGSGIFVSPKGVHEYAGSVGLSLIIWASGGVFVAMGAHCYSELGTLIRKSGGDYAYISIAFGPFIGFVRLWIEAIVIRPCTITITSLTFAKYALVPIFGNCEYTPTSEPLLACCCIFALTFINCYSVKLATKIQDIFTFAKVLALILIISTGLVILCIRGSVSFENAFEGSSMDIGRISLALYAGLFAYNGWNYLNYIVEELKDPTRNLPLAIVISCTIVTIINTLTNIAFYTVIPPDSYLLSDATAMAFASRVYGSLAFVMPVAVALATVGSCNGVILTASRLFFAGAREGQMPLMLTLISTKYLTPLPATMLTGFISCLYLVLSQNIYELINYVQIVNWLAITFGILSLFRLRRKMANAPRPIKVHLVFPVVFLAGCVFLVIVPVIAKPVDTVIGLAIMLTSVPVYFLFIRWPPERFGKLSQDAMLAVQKLCVAVPEESESDE